MGHSCQKSRPSAVNPLPWLPKAAHHSHTSCKSDGMVHNYPSPKTCTTLIFHNKAIIDTEGQAHDIDSKYKEANELFLSMSWAWVWVSSNRKYAVRLWLWCAVYDCWVICTQKFHLNSIKFSNYKHGFACRQGMQFYDFCLFVYFVVFFFFFCQTAIEINTTTALNRIKVSTSGMSN